MILGVVKMHLYDVKLEVREMLADLLADEWFLEGWTMCVYEHQIHLQHLVLH